MKRKLISPHTLQALGLSAAAVLLTVCAALVATLVAGTLASCEHKGFCEPEAAVSKVHVIFDWRKAPGSSATGMSLYLYPEDGGEMLRYDFDNAAGGTVEIPHGRYRALCVNNDTETVLLKGTEKYGTFEAYTRKSFLLEPLGMQTNPSDVNPTDEAVALPADRFWVGREEEVEILPARAAAGAPYGQEVTLYPVQETSYYTVEIRNARNLKYVSALSFSLSGLSGSLTAADGARSPLRTTLPFEGRGDEAASAITGSFHTFGLSASVNKVRTLTLYAVLSDGSKQYYTFDVAAQVNEAKDPKRVRILIDGLTLPKPIVEPGGGGFQPSVDDWMEETIEMEM